MSNLSQDEPKGIKSPDSILRVRQGQNYGFPKCTWVTPSACKSYAKPFKFLPPHTSPGGLGIIGNRLYFSEFGFVFKPLVVSMPLGGGPVTPLLKGFVAPIVALGTNGGWVYVGELTGQVWRVKA
jgi:hypothetical protein